MFTEEHTNAIKAAIIAKIQSFVDTIGHNDAIKSIKFDGDNIHIEFSEAVDIDEQDVINTFIYGGAIKKSNTEGKDKEEQFFKISSSVGVF